MARFQGVHRDLSRKDQLLALGLAKSMHIGRERRRLLERRLRERRTSAEDSPMLRPRGEDRRQRHRRARDIAALPGVPFH